MPAMKKETINIPTISIFMVFSSCGFWWRKFRREGKPIIQNGFYRWNRFNDK